MGNNSNLYKLDGKVPLMQAIPFGLQHVLAMFVANITPIIIRECSRHCPNCQCRPDTELYDHRWYRYPRPALSHLAYRIPSPHCDGYQFHVPLRILTIGTSQGMGVLMGAVIIGGLLEGLLGLFAKYWIKLIPHIVAATVVTAIGFSLLPIGANSFAGGQGAADFGAANNWLVGTFTLLVCLGFQIFGKGFLRSLSVLIGLIAGYILAMCMGMVDFSGLSNAGVVSLPQILPFKPEFDLGATLSIIAIFLVSATETIGDTSALCSSALKRTTHKIEMGASVACDGFVSSIAGVFGCTPITSFSQNVGLAAMSGVINRFTIATGAGIMILGGIFPVVGHLLTTIPQSVLGGCTIMMFGSIMYAGFRMMANCGFSDRNMIIAALSLSIGLGFTQATGMFSIFPKIIQTVFAENCVAVVFLLAVLLNLILPKDHKENPKKING